MRLWLILSLVILAALPAAAAPEGQPVTGGAILQATIGDATSMIPRITSDSSSSEVQSLIYNSLLKADKDLNIVGDLAESWEVSPDGLVITFHLRKGVRFSDGQPYTAQDALFTYQFMVDPKTPTPYAGDYLKVSKAEAVDDYTFRVTYPEPYAPGLYSWALSQLPAHLLKGQDVRQSPLNRQPVGTGPYILKSWEQGNRLILNYNPDYWEGRAYLDQVQYRVIPDLATMFLELRSGGVDMMGLTALQYSRQTNTEFFKENFRKYRYLASAYTYMGYNLNVPMFQDKRVRQALSHAIDKEEIIKGVLLGLGKVATGPYKPGTPWYNPDVPRYPYDPEKAKALLKEAGWVDSDKDGWLDKEGRPFSFTIITNQGNAARQNAAVIIQHRLAQQGIKVEVRTIEWAAFLKEFIQPGRFQACILAWTIPLEPDLYDVWHSDKAVKGGLNFTGFKNAEVDELIIKGQKTFDPAERKRYYDRIQVILAEEQPYTFLYVPEALPIVNARFQGIEPAPAGIDYNFIRWWVPKALQRHQIVP